MVTCDKHCKDARCSGSRCSPRAAGGPAAWSSGFTAQGDVAGESCGTGSERQAVLLLLLPWHAECWVAGGGRQVPSDCTDSRAWMFLSLWSLPGMVAMSEIVSVRNFNVHKIKTMLRVEIKSSLC